MSQAAPSHLAQAVHRYVADVGVPFPVCPNAYAAACAASRASRPQRPPPMPAVIPRGGPRGFEPVPGRHYYADPSSCDSGRWGVIGAFMTLSGIVTMVTTSFSGIWLAISRVVTIVATFALVPLFAKPIDDVIAGVDAAAGFMAHRAHVLQHGIPASGRVVEIQQPGRTINYRLEVVAVVEVHHPQHGVCQTQTTALVPQLGIPYVQPGAQVQLQVNPGNPQDVALLI